jgi:hypothetical protein
VGWRVALVASVLLVGCGGGSSAGGHDASGGRDARPGDGSDGMGDGEATAGTPGASGASGAGGAGGVAGGVDASGGASAPEGGTSDVAPEVASDARSEVAPTSDAADAKADGADAGARCPGPLVGLYHFEESTGPVVDSSGCRNDGVASAGVTRGASGVGLAATFDGTDAVVTVPGIDASLLDGDFTFEAWVFRAAGTGGAVISLVGPGSTEGVWVWSDTDGKVNVSTGDDTCTGKRDWGPATVKLASGGWSHVAVDMLRGSPSPLRYFHIYIDGTFALAAAGAQTAFCHDPGAALYIGAVGPLTSLPWSGRIDEVKVWAVSRDRSGICQDAGGVYGSTCDVSAVRPQ